MLFSSVDGISKVGYYTGTGSDRSISFGFAPRFLMVKRADAAYDWYMLDTLRGFVSGNDAFLTLNTTETSTTSTDFGTPTSTGIDIVGGLGHINANNAKYIYYAHA